MSTKIGRFEILSELARSNSGCVYKASDPESGQTVALKTIHLDAFGERAPQVVERILQEAESTKDLTSINLTLVYGAGEIDGELCATMEYIQGNSIATMLSRREGFSIWDLLDISRQVCQGLDHAHQHNVFHYNLEPAKVMVTWDGTVKILSLGISSKGFVDAGAEGAPPSTLYYMSPEQVRGESMDARSNLFTWGAMLYEMVTDRKAFDGADADAVRQQILETMPTPPAQINPKINPVASEVIMKAVAKDPAARYQSGHDLAADLEKCREATGKTASKPAPAPKGPAIPDQVKAVAAARFSSAPAPKTPAPATPKFEVKAPEPAHTQSSSQLEELDTSWGVPSAPPAKSPIPPAKAAAAAAGSASGGARAKSTTPKLDPSAQFISSVVKASMDSLENQNATMSSATLDEPSVEQPKIAVDPMMAGGAAAARKGASFSDLSELPPLKEIYIAPPAPKSESSEQAPLHPSLIRRGEPEKPKIQPREVAEKALKEIKSVPPQLLMYSIAGALALIIVIGLAVLWHSHSQSTDEEGGPVSAPTETTTEAPQPAPTPPHAAPQASAPEPVQSAPQAEAPAEPSAPAAEEPAPRKASRLAAAPAPRGKGKKQQASRATIPGQLIVNSIPDGAQVQIDGRGDPSWVTPYTVTAIASGEHVVTVSKSGFVSDTRTIDITSANRSSVTAHLITLVATLTISSEPVGASIFVDGKDTQHVTPSQISLEKGTHTILVRKPGFLDETVSENAQPGQNLRFAPSLRALGNVDDIKTVGKFKKLFGGGGTQAGMAKVSIKTTPKGAQIAINRRILEKTSPMEFLLNPGNYIVDITLSGYKPVQRVITVEQNNNTIVEETLQPE